MSGREMRQGPIERPGRVGLDAAELLGFFVVTRASMLPIIIGMLALVTVIDLRPMRLVVLAVAALLLIGLTLSEKTRHVRMPVDLARVPINAFVSAIVILLILLTTGGVSSPLVPGVVILSFASSSVSGRGTFRWQLVTGVAGGLFLMAGAQAKGVLEAFSPGWLLPSSFVQPSAWHPYVVASVLTFLMTVASIAGVKVHEVIDRMIHQAIAARDEVLRSYYEQAQDLTALSGEIAHELKNPLTSIKGLAGLMALELKEGKSAERLATLRREVDRMQGILEEFLNFSRPLVVLSQSEVRLSSLCEDVVALHEGVLEARGVGASVTGEAEVRGDPRKLRQIVINVMQNALEASSHGGHIALRIVKEGQEVRVLLEDEGTGISTALGERIFDAGVTSKARGSGLGLTIARALARQHGGDLLLENRLEGGCRATLRLPEGGVE